MRCVVRCWRRARYLLKIPCFFLPDPNPSIPGTWSGLRVDFSTGFAGVCMLGWAIASGGLRGLRGGVGLGARPDGWWSACVLFFIFVFYTSTEVGSACHSKLGLRPTQILLPVKYDGQQAPAMATGPGWVGFFRAGQIGLLGCWVSHDQVKLKLMSTP